MRVAGIEQNNEVSAPSFSCLSLSDDVKRKAYHRAVSAAAKSVGDGKNTDDVGILLLRVIISCRRGNDGGARNIAGAEYP